MAESTSPQSPPAHAALATVFQVRDDELQVLLWKRARDPFRGDWSLPGGSLGPGETLEESILRHLAAKVDVREVAHLEQLGTWSDPSRHPEQWELATAYLGLVPLGIDPRVPVGHTLAAGGHAAGHRVRSRRRSSSRDASGCAGSSRTRTSASRSPRRRSRSRSYATSTQPPSGTTSPRPTSSASCSAAARSRRPAGCGHTAPPAAGPAEVFRFRKKPPRGHRSVRGAAPAGVTRLLPADLREIFKRAPTTRETSCALKIEPPASDL